MLAGESRALPGDMGCWVWLATVAIAFPEQGLDGREIPIKLVVCSHAVHKPPMLQLQSSCAEVIRLSRWVEDPMQTLRSVSSARLLRSSQARAWNQYWLCSLIVVCVRRWIEGSIAAKVIGFTTSGVRVPQTSCRKASCVVQYWSLL